MMRRNFWSERARDGKTAAAASWGSIGIAGPLAMVKKRMKMCLNINEYGYEDENNHMVITKLIAQIREIYLNTHSHRQSCKLCGILASSMPENILGSWIWHKILI